MDIDDLNSNQGTKHFCINITLFSILGYFTRIAYLCQEISESMGLQETDQHFKI